MACKWILVKQIFYVTFAQGSDQVTCIIQDGNVVWSAAVPRCDGDQKYFYSFVGT